MTVAEDLSGGLFFAAAFFRKGLQSVMSKYVVKRLLYMIPVLLGVLFLVFTILSLTPGRSRFHHPGYYGKTGRYRCPERGVRL